MAALTLLPLSGLAASDTAHWVEAHCAGCHSLDRDAYDAEGIAARSERKGPPLFYAGSKFREEWLESWLVSPEPIRVAGDFPPRHIKSVDGMDVVDTETLQDHPALEEERATAVAAYLMSLKSTGNADTDPGVVPGDTAFRLAQMNFAKFNNCIACHRDEPEYGGVSGPELYSAWKRLQPGFIASYIVNPVAWDPYTLMPAQDLNTSAVQKLVDYIKLLAEEPL